MSDAEPTTPGADGDEVRDLVRTQFGANAANYAASPVHARGSSLTRLVEVLEPDPSWRLLDIATAAGHTAFAFAPAVAEVVASDLLDEMLDVARGQAAERGVANVTFEVADAESLPFEDSSFDAVTCRIAPHHFPRPDRFVAEVARVLRPGGRFGLVDNMVDAEASAFVNHFEKRRDPSHVRALSLDEWLELVEAAGMSVTAVERLRKRMVFETWADNMSVPDPVRVELLADLESAPDAAVAYLEPELGEPGDQSAAAFHLTEGVVAATRP
ncbi:MAG: methyltransferase domain-containing protein [Actinomycetota bacterium]